MACISPPVRMCSFNPYAQWNDLLETPPISLFGALPYPDAPPLPDPFVTFRFASFETSIMNSTIFGPHHRPCYRIETDPTGFTVLKNLVGLTVSFIEWQEHPCVEIRDRVSKRKVCNWLKVSSDLGTRTMEVDGRQYTWSACDEHIQLHSDDPTAPSLMARISSSRGQVTLELGSHAMRVELLEVFLTATLLLQCGRNID